jgi:hypothetical protein
VTIVLELEETEPRLECRGCDHREDLVRVLYWLDSKPELGTILHAALKAGARVAEAG